MNYRFLVWLVLWSSGLLLLWTSLGTPWQMLAMLFLFASSFFRLQKTDYSQAVKWYHIALIFAMVALMIAANAFLSDEMEQSTLAFFKHPLPLSVFWLGGILLEYRRLRRPKTPCAVPTTVSASRSR